MSTADHHARLRAKFRPFPREAHYPTGWNGESTFAEIRAALMPSINRLMRYYHYVEVDIPDMIAHGFMRLWEELSKQPDLFAEVDQGGAVKWVMYRSGNSHYQKFYRREMYLEDLATRNGDPDEFLIDGYDDGRTGAQHSQYAEAIDLRVDITRVLEHMSEKYLHSQAHLAALYYITTSVKPNDAAELAGRGGTKQAWWITSVVKPMREELCELLELSRPPKTTWKDKLSAGDDAPLRQLVTALEADGRSRLATVVASLSRHESCAQQMEQLELSRSNIFYLRRVAHQELNQAYDCRV